MARNPGFIQTALVSTATALSGSAVDGANGNYFPMTVNGRFVAHITNTGANAITAVMLQNTSVEGVTVPSQTAVVPSGITGRQWALPAKIATQSDGSVYFDWSGGAATALTIISMQYIPLTGV